MGIKLQKNMSGHKKYPSSYQEEFQIILTLLPSPLAILLSYFMKITALVDVILGVNSG